VIRLRLDQQFDGILRLCYDLFIRGMKLCLCAMTHSRATQIYIWGSRIDKIIGLFSRI